MSAQNVYKFNPDRGFAGGIYDLAPHEINTFLNEENTGAMEFGIGVVGGTVAGKQIKKPASTAEAGDFLGITVNNRTTTYDLEGVVHILKDAAVGVMKYGRIWAKVAEGEAPAFGDAVYLITDGEEASHFAKAAGSYTAVQLANCTFVTAAENGVAVIEIANAPAAGSPTYTLPAATASALGGVKVGTGLSVTADGTLSVAGE